MAVYGLDPSFNHVQNGMTHDDMVASLKVANQLDEVIIFRSTGPWSRRWIERRYPTKNFHVKGKSSDWGPQAGFVPYLGTYSKVGADSDKANAGTKKNDSGLEDGYADKVQLALSLEELFLQNNQTEEHPQRLAVSLMERAPNGQDYVLFATRPGDLLEFAFLAVLDGPVYKIFAYPQRAGATRAELLLGAMEPLMVMTSSESGADNKPMTGDYDLMAVCPTWRSYGSTTSALITKPGLLFNGRRGLQSGLSFDAGARLDKVLDMSSNTGARPMDGDLKKTFHPKGKPADFGAREHPDMGNLTPRILRCINSLNEAMGETGAKRRVHHNAESHRNHLFAALTESEMNKGDGLPLTVFQPRALLDGKMPTCRYLDVATLETLAEFKEYAAKLHEAGYFVPRNWTWGMSIRNRPT